MKKSLNVLLMSTAVFMASCSSTSSDGVSKRGTHHFSIVNALSSPKAQEVLNPNIRTQFASGSGKIIRKGLVSNKKTNAVNKSAEEACQIAFLSAVKQFQSTAQKNGASKVINLVSYYKKNTFSSNTEYECEVGALMAGVALKGDIAR